MFELTTAAELDIADIYNHTSRLWGVIQAEDYLQFLKDQMQRLSDEPDLGRAVAQRAGLRIHTAKFNRSRMSHGHRIVYREIKNGIRVIRFIHTAMDLDEALRFIE